MKRTMLLPGLVLAAVGTGYMLFSGASSHAVETPQKDVWPFQKPQAEEQAAKGGSNRLQIPHKMPYRVGIWGLSEAVAGAEAIVMEVPQYTNLPKEASQYALSPEDLVQTVKASFQEYGITVVTLEEVRLSQRDRDHMPILTGGPWAPRLNVSLDTFKQVGDHSYDARISLSFRSAMRYPEFERFDLTGISPEVDRLQEKYQEAMQQFDAFLTEHNLPTWEEAQFTVRQLVYQLETIEGGLEALRKPGMAEKALIRAKQQLMEDINNGMPLEKSIQSMTCSEAIWRREYRLLGPLDDLARAQHRALSELIEDFAHYELSVLVKAQ